MQEEGKEDGGHITTKRKEDGQIVFLLLLSTLGILSYAIRSCMHNFLSVETAQTQFSYVRNHIPLLV